MMPSNSAFKRKNPDFPTPPFDLAFDAYNNVHWDNYKKLGKQHASIFTDVVKSRIPPKELSILEWGCGPGRLIRHMEDLLPGYTVEVTGTDYNSRTIDWCKDNLPKYHFALNELMPPLPLGDKTYDVIYCFSVFTHLSEEAQRAWAIELKRRLNPGGLFICTTHGDNCLHLLTSKKQLDTYNAGQVVLKGNYVEGKKWYLAVHPEKFVRTTLLDGLTDITLVEVGDENHLLQDVWVGMKPTE
jgi:SAM-dependent methyltransferase